MVNAYFAAKYGRLGRIRRFRGCSPHFRHISNPSSPSTEQGQSLRHKARHRRFQQKDLSRLSPRQKISHSLSDEAVPTGARPFSILALFFDVNWRSEKFDSFKFEAICGENSQVGDNQSVIFGIVFPFVRNWAVWAEFGPIFTTCPNLAAFEPELSLLIHCKRGLGG